jgi:glycosyltransferase involved in cell wall biosynthesis
MFISVVVPNYNGFRTICDTLDALLHQSLPRSRYEVIVVDDGSADESVAYLDNLSASCEGVRIIIHPSNKGLSAARNSGIHASRGDILIFVDSDIIVDTNFIETHARMHEDHSDRHIAVVSNLSFHPKCIKNSNFGRFLNSRYIGNRSPLARRYLNYENLPPRCFGGGISSVRRSDLFNAGLFDENIRGYGSEDEKMGYMLSRCGVRILFAREARAVHCDTVSLKRTKLKTIELYLGGYRTLLEQSPEYFERSMVRYLLPVNWAKDSPNVIMFKLILAITLNKLVLILIETWLLRTDRVSFLYCPPLFRILMAGWGYHAVRSHLRDVKMVHYGVDR